MGGNAYSEYLKERIRYWEKLRESAQPYVHNPELEAKHYHDVWSTAAQVLLSALWEFNGRQEPTMREIMAEDFPHAWKHWIEKGGT